LLLRIGDGVYKLWAHHFKAVFIYHSLNKTLRARRKLIATRNWSLELCQNRRQWKDYNALRI